MDVNTNAKQHSFKLRDRKGYLLKFTIAKNIRTGSACSVALIFALLPGSILIAVR